MLLEAVALLREIRDLLARPATRAPLTRADRALLVCLLPAIEGDRGAEPFASRDLLMSAGSRFVIGRFAPATVYEWRCRWTARTLVALALCERQKLILRPRLA